VDEGYASDCEDEIIVSDLLKYNLREKPFFMVFLGSSGVGKSTLIDYLCNGKVNRNLPPTTPVVLTSKIIPCTDGPHTHIRMSVFECNGSEEGYTAAKQLCENADGYVLCYDCIDVSSFETLNDYAKLLTAKKKRTAILVGLKQDLVDNERIIRASRVLAFQEDHSFCGSYEISTFRGEHEKVFVPALKRLLQASREEAEAKTSYRSMAPHPILLHTRSLPLDDVDGGLAKDVGEMSNNPTTPTTSTPRSSRSKTVEFRRKFVSF
jgi:GTPase SAR1 family protein